MPNLVQELNSLDFSVYIGGPMQATAAAGYAASMSQVSFIQAVGFEDDPNNVPDGKKLRYVDFSFAKSVANEHYGKEEEDLVAEGLTASQAAIIVVDKDNKFLTEDVTIKVPFLTMLTIPALRVEELKIDFNAKLTSVETANVSTEFAASAELGINYKIINFKASASYKRTSTRGVSVEKTYNLGVTVTAVNDELPAGLDRILTMLEDSIASMNA